MVKLMPISYLLTSNRGANGYPSKVPPVEKIPRLFNDNNKREFYEQKKNDVKVTAAILRISEERTDSKTTR
jgi:hypothetical protein